MIRLAVDAMGGDYAPHEIVAGTLSGAAESEVSITLVGDPAAIQRELAAYDTTGLEFRIAPAPDVIRMDEDPASAVRSRPNASINVACRLVLDGEADGVVTMGHSGAALIAAFLHFGRIEGISRPAFIVPYLGLREGLYILDIGGNTDVRPAHLVEFALMGSAYVSRVAGTDNPRVGLLSNGAEPNKGNKVTKEAYRLLARLEGIRFVGNIEGHDLFTGGVDVVICDGFLGNVMFKTSEGVISTVIDQVEEILPQLDTGPAEILTNHLASLRARNHYARYGAATLLGAKYPLFLGHGRSKALAVQNSLATAKKTIAGDVVGAIQQALSGALNL